MANTIKSRVFNSVEDKRVRLSNSNFVRQWSSDLGTSWTKIRIGCRISMDDFGVDLASTPVFAFGICSGTSNIFMDATTTHFFGSVSNAATWARTTGPVKYNIGSVFGSMYIAKRIGSTLTFGTRTETEVILMDCTLGLRSCMFIDITKGSPNFTCQAFQNSSGTSDVPLSTFLSQLPLAVPVISGHTFGLANTLAIDEATNGYFNAVNVSWDRTSPAIEISDLAVVKFS